MRNVPIIVWCGNVMKIDKQSINSGARCVIDLLENAGYETRVVGGSVRDLILNQAPKDWDLATTATPDQVMAVMKKWHIRVIPTGLQHGTVTAMIDDEGYEITTLRVDEETDGRHATVSFTTDWKLDASRRDFTMNAMSMDADGEVYDYFHGIDDLTQSIPVVRFVNSPSLRIQEDYLRILRFFRFKARVLEQTKASWTWGVGELEARTAIKKYSVGLTEISGERIWSELQKILSYPTNGISALHAMHETGVVDSIGLTGIMKRSYNMTKYRRLDQRVVVSVAACFAEDQIQVWIDLLKNRFHASNEELDVIRFVAKHNHVDRTMKEAYRLLADHPWDYVMAWIAVGHNATKTIKEKPAQETIHSSRHAPNQDTGLYTQLHRAISKLEGVIPEFPVTGQDLIDRGLSPGPEFGKIIKIMKQDWADSFFIKSKEQLFADNMKDEVFVNE